MPAIHDRRAEPRRAEVSRDDAPTGDGAPVHARVHRARRRGALLLHRGRRRHLRPAPLRDRPDRRRRRGGRAGVRRVRPLGARAPADRRTTRRRARPPPAPPRRRPARRHEPRADGARRELRRDRRAPAPRRRRRGGVLRRRVRRARGPRAARAPRRGALVQLAGSLPRHRARAAARRGARPDCPASGSRGPAPPHSPWRPRACPCSSARRGRTRHPTTASVTSSTAPPCRSRSGSSPRSWRWAGSSPSRRCTPSASASRTRASRCSCTAAWSSSAASPSHASPIGCRRSPSAPRRSA